MLIWYTSIKILIKDNSNKGPGMRCMRSVLQNDMLLIIFKCIISLSQKIKLSSLAILNESTYCVFQHCY